MESADEVWSDDQATRLAALAASLMRPGPGPGPRPGPGPAAPAPAAVGARRLVGITGAPGAGKSTFVAAVAERVGDRAACLPMDGFHLADVELARQGLTGRKGAPETFDAWGYAALLRRVRERPDHVVYAPGFERTLEQPLAGAVAIGPQVELVLTEGNYLLLDRPEWRAVAELLDEVWYVATDEPVRRARLRARHIASGKSATAAAAWVTAVDEPNARLVEQTRCRADRTIDLTRWRAAPATPP